MCLHYSIGRAPNDTFRRLKQPRIMNVSKTFRTKVWAAYARPKGGQLSTVLARRSLRIGHSEAEPR